MIPVSCSCFISSVMSVNVSTWDSEITFSIGDCGRESQIWWGWCCGWVINFFAFEEQSRSIWFSINNNHVKIWRNWDLRNFSLFVIVILISYWSKLSQWRAWYFVGFDNEVLFSVWITVWSCPRKHDDCLICGEDFFVGLECYLLWLSVVFVCWVVKINSLIGNSPFKVTAKNGVGPWRHILIFTVGWCCFIKVIWICINRNSSTKIWNLEWFRFISHS